MNEIHIISPGLFTTIQDAGRYGYQGFGMPVAGAMDQLSYALANLLVGNTSGEAVLEATLTGPEIAFTAHTYLAVCGADMQARLNGYHIPMNQTIEVEAGSTLSFGTLVSGCRTYIAFTGGLDIEPVMQSRSTYVRAAIGGLHGRPLKAGDRLTINQGADSPTARQAPAELHTAAQLDMPYSLIPGPEIKRVGYKALESLLTTPYILSEYCDRMGYRLQGEPLVFSEGARPDILSAGTVAGTLQLPADGQPILLMADRQTTGGYARLAIMASTDINRAAQLKPGDTMRFEEISIKKAQKKFRLQHKLLQEISN